MKMPSKLATLFVCVIGLGLATELATPHAAAQTTLGNVTGSISNVTCSTLAADRGGHGFESPYFTECHGASPKETP
jgi:hypothetical protein